MSRSQSNNPVAVFLWGEAARPADSVVRKSLTNPSSSIEYIRVELRMKPEDTDKATLQDILFVAESSPEFFHIGVVPSHVLNYLGGRILTA